MISRDVGMSAKQCYLIWSGPGRLPVRSRGILAINSQVLNNLVQPESFSFFHFWALNFRSPLRLPSSVAIPGFSPEVTDFPDFRTWEALFYPLLTVNFYCLSQACPFLRQERTELEYSVEPSL